MNVGDKVITLFRTQKVIGTITELDERYGGGVYIVPDSSKIFHWTAEGYEPAQRLRQSKSRVWLYDEDGVGEYNRYIDNEIDALLYAKEKRK